MNELDFSSSAWFVLIVLVSIFVSIQYLVGPKPIKELVLVFLTRGLIKTLIGLIWGLILGVALAIIELVVDPQQRPVATLITVALFFALSMLSSVGAYKVALAKVFQISVSWTRIAKSIALELVILVVVTGIVLVIAAMM